MYLPQPFHVTIASLALVGAPTPRLTRAHKIRKCFIVAMFQVRDYSMRWDRGVLTKFFKEKMRLLFAEKIFSMSRKELTDWLNSL